MNPCRRPLGEFHKRVPAQRPVAEYPHRLAFAVTGQGLRKGMRHFLVRHQQMSMAGIAHRLAYAILLKDSAVYLRQCISEMSIIARSANAMLPLLVIMR